ncbi:transposase [Streptomyces sp. Ru73]|uniref:transposase n=1 Tax=Streptomyces sp. Ru73 TaxID=2080748 RepID=UPI002690DF47
MTSENVTEQEPIEPATTLSAPAVDDQLIDEPVNRAQAEGLRLTGEGGRLQQLTKRLLESTWRARSPTISAVIGTLVFLSRST